MEAKSPRPFCDFTLPNQCAALTLQAKRVQILVTEMFTNCCCPRETCQSCNSVA